MFQPEVAENLSIGGYRHEKYPSHLRRGKPMTKYDGLDASTELEQKIAQDLEDAFGKRGLTVNHRGGDTHAPAGEPDIVMYNDSVAITVEPTKSTGADQDREFNSIRDHLNSIKEEYPAKTCYCVFVSPDTSNRMLDSIEDHNFTRQKVRDEKILPLSFENLELLVSRLSGAVADLYLVGNFLDVFTEHADFIDDKRIKQILYECLFQDDEELKQEIEKEVTERDQELLENLIEDLENLEDYLREQGIATGETAIDTLIYLVFIKLYEEQRLRNGEGQNRLKNEHFQRYKGDLHREVRESNRAIHQLFETIQSEEEFHESGMFSDRDKLPEDLTDEFILNKVMPVFDKYNFLGTKVDALGAVYEVLALRANKDVKVGQFFTPENIVDSMVELADLNPNDLVLDPACGTGRFLIGAMEDMLTKVDDTGIRDKSSKKNEIRNEQLFGSDIDNRIAKIAKMNMWVHGDGKSNILKHNGLTLKDVESKSDTFDESVDAILTNPPLGKLSYSEGYDDDFREHMQDVLPVKNATQDRLETIQDRIERHKTEKKEMIEKKIELEKTDEVSEYLELKENGELEDCQERIDELEDIESVNEYQKLKGKIKRKQSTIERNEDEEAELRMQIRNGDSEYEVTGNKIKGGALFLKVAADYLKHDRNPDALPEWRGGELVTVLDEGILNTGRFERVRSFIEDNFYIKAVISLTTDTFVPVSNTSTKTSILYCTRKEHQSDTQKEPIFFAHVDKVGLDTKGKACENKLPDVLQEYQEFRAAVKDAYVGKEFRKDQFDWEDV